APPQREMLARDEAPVRQDRRSFEHVPQLTDVAGPVVVGQRLACVARDPGRRSSEAAPDLVQERLAQRKNVVRTVAKGRDVDVEDVKSVKEIGTKCAARDGRA